MFDKEKDLFYKFLKLNDTWRQNELDKMKYIEQFWTQLNQVIYSKWNKFSK